MRTTSLWFPAQRRRRMLSCRWHHARVCYLSCKNESKAVQTMLRRKRTRKRKRTRRIRKRRIRRPLGMHKVDTDATGVLSTNSFWEIPLTGILRICLFIWCNAKCMRHSQFPRTKRRRKRRRTRKRKNVAMRTLTGKSQRSSSH